MPECKQKSALKSIPVYCMHLLLAYYHRVISYDRSQLQRNQDVILILILRRTDPDKRCRVESLGFQSTPHPEL